MVAHHPARLIRYSLITVGVLLLWFLLSDAHGRDSRLNQLSKLDQEQQLILKHQKNTNQESLLNLLLHGSEKSKCPNYVDYSKRQHKPYSQGKLQLPFQRPTEECRTFKSSAIEKIIEDFKIRIGNPDLARLFENCLPNTLDTTIMWHKNKTSIPKKSSKNKTPHRSGPSNYFDFNEYKETFIVTGDIHAEWLRDSTWQLSAYQKFSKYDQHLKDLIVGAINTQARYIIYDPYCNAFQPPPESGVSKERSSIDNVFPRPNWVNVFECKWELDSLTSFISLTNQYYENTKDDSIFTELWESAMDTIFMIIKREQTPTFNEEGKLLPFKYTFQRDTNIGSETLPLTGSGNPVNFNTKLIRSAFRPSDDACIFQLFIPANAYLVSELNRLSKILDEVKVFPVINEQSKLFAKEINESIYTYGVVEHSIHGKVFAYETDGYGSALFMDDANIPSLLSLPDLGFIKKEDPIYKNTRKMILDKKYNPYYIKGKHFEGIGGPHVGYRYAWPMSLCVKIRTSNDDEEVKHDLTKLIESTASLGLMHEGINVGVAGGEDYTRSWFAWCNSEFGKTIIDLAKRKPHLIFNNEYKNKPYDIDEEFNGVFFT